MEASPATAADAEFLHELVDTDPVEVKEVIADTAYGSGDTRVAMANRRVTLVAPAQPPGRKPGRFSIADFDIDVTGNRTTCPAGHSVTPARRVSSADRIQFRFPAAVCAACPLRNSCTESARGRTLTVGAHTALLQRVRNQRCTPHFVDRYRHRANVERKAAQVESRAPKIPWRGLPQARHGSDSAPPPSTSTVSAASTCSPPEHPATQRAQIKDQAISPSRRRPSTPTVINPLATPIADHPPRLPQ